MRLYMLLLAVSVICCGCRTPGRLGVANAANGPVTDIRVYAGDTVIYEQAAIESKEVGDYVKLESDLPMVSRLSWKNEAGQLLEKEVTLKKKLPGKFNGRVLYEINRHDAARIFILDSDDNGGSLIPWGFSEDFDGTINMPGMNR